MNDDLSTLDHLQKLAKSSRQYTDSLVLELNTLVIDSMNDLQNKISSPAFELGDTLLEDYNDCLVPMGGCPID